VPGLRHCSVRVLLSHCSVRPHARPHLFVRICSTVSVGPHLFDRICSTVPVGPHVRPHLLVRICWSASVRPHLLVVVSKHRPRTDRDLCVGEKGRVDHDSY
jgi:hypothetical protein